jgi:hypothetical protein
MARPKKKIEEQDENAPALDPSTPYCHGCFYAESINSEIFRKCNLTLPPFFKVTGPPVVHRDSGCSFFTPKG